MPSGVHILKCKSALTIEASLRPGLLVLCAFVCVASGCGSSSPTVTTTSSTITLTYPQTSISATVGTPIQTDTPTVTGTVAGYSVAPALPAGITLNTSTGVISGTPTTATAQASYTITASNSSGSTTAAVQITVSTPQSPPPSNLVYPRTSISATVGVPIQPDTPTVTGTVTSYSVAPALPPQLALNTLTGAISGTPGISSAQANYTITASNSGGSTTATVQISIDTQPPSNLVYPQMSISATLGTPIQTDTPTVSGNVTSYSSLTGLPAGLTLNTSTGAISGTPAAASAQANYIITASNPYGSTTANISITVTAVSIALPGLVLTGAAKLQESASNILTVDGSYWALWDSANGNEIVSGTGAGSSQMGCLQSETAMGGSTAVIDLGPLEVLALPNGQVLSTITDNSAFWWQLAPDGSYIVVGDSNALTVWSPNGEKEFAVPGDYSSACAVSAVGKVELAEGPAGANVTQTISVPSGATSVTPAFSGTFSFWFNDGSHFVSNLAGTSFIYSNSGVLQGTLNGVQLQGGYGNLAFLPTSVPSSGVPQITVYPIGSSAGTNFPSGGESSYTFSGSQIDILTLNSSTVDVIDLSGSIPIETAYSVTLTSPIAFAAYSTSQWVASDSYGRVFAEPANQYLGYGEVLSMAGSPDMVVISTAVGKTLFYDLNGPTGPTLTSSVNNLEAAQMALSSNDSVLGVLNLAQTYVTYYSLPSMNPISEFAGPSAVTMSASGTTIAQYQAQAEGDIVAAYYDADVTGITGTPVYLEATGIYLLVAFSHGIVLSPDGTLAAVPLSGEDGVPPYGTEIYKNGTLVAAVSGLPTGWIDNNQLLVANVVQDPIYGRIYSGDTIYSATGATIANAPIPVEIDNPEFPSAGLVHDPEGDAVYSISTGNLVFEPTGPIHQVLGGTAERGVVCGPYICAQSGNQVVAFAY